MKTNKYLGLKFNRLTILEIKSYNKDKHSTFVLCKCDCGSYKEISLQLLKTNKTKSCGCLKSEVSRKNLTGQIHARKPQGEAGLNRLISTIKNNAKKRNLEYKLTKDEVKYLTQKNCFYCGKEPNQIAMTTPKAMTEKGLENSKFVYNGLDRINNSIGYTLENIVPCCNLCNWMKRDLTYENFKKHINMISNNITNKG